MIEESVRTTDGLNLFLRTMHPAGTTHGVVVIVHGFNAHGGYYLWVAEQPAGAGLSVYLPDLRGRGRSDGERFYVDSFADYVSDIASVVTLATSCEPGVPVFLLGHSAGGVASCLYVLDHQAELAGLICESFAYQLPAPDFALAVLKGLSHIAPHAHVLKLHNADFSRDPAVVQKMDADPLIANKSQRTQTLAAMARADDRLSQDFPRIRLPLLILHGTADRAAKSSGSQYFHETAGSADKTLKLYDGHFHDLLNDLGRDGVMNDITAWIAARVPEPKRSKS